MKLSLGTTENEGFYVVLKPEDRESSLAHYASSFTVFNIVFNFGNESFPINVITRKLPEVMLVMKTCDEAHSDKTNHDAMLSISVDVITKTRTHTCTRRDE